MPVPPFLDQVRFGLQHLQIINNQALSKRVWCSRDYARCSAERELAISASAVFCRKRAEPLDDTAASLTCPRLEYRLSLWVSLLQFGVVNDTLAELDKGYHHGWFIRERSAY